MKEVVIRMSDSMFERIMKAQSIPDMYGADIVNAMNGIKSGTVLPEGHGDLIDRKVVYAEFNNADLSRKEMIGKLLVFGVPTVIPADKESSDADSN